MRKLSFLHTLEKNSRKNSRDDDHSPWRQVRRYSDETERKRDQVRERVASRPAAREVYDVADYRPGLRSGSTRAPASGNPSYHPRKPSCRRRGVLRNVGAATVGPAVPLTIPFSLCPPFRRERYSIVTPLVVMHIIHKRVQFGSRARA
ncbi:uncharacterized protein LOC113562237 isoform X2 [Ooceraea biroi]|uniref:uncharacterized protein LOC113562237 isoform X2 n=1 Tax=Ooceraea biroi TaxID=2015173 RepID=UPI000F07C620|nr:uncharacterized protein LOC113562237 isoform X2 [Ooceraea biroi]